MAHRLEQRGLRNCCCGGKRNATQGLLANLPARGVCRLMDPLFWILAGVVAACVVGILVIWRLEVRAERRAPDTRQVEAEVSARLKVFDRRAVVEQVDTHPMPATPQPVKAVAQAVPPAW